MTNNVSTLTDSEIQSMFYTTVAQDTDKFFGVELGSLSREGLYSIIGWLRNEVNKNTQANNI